MFEKEESVLANRLQTLHQLGKFSVSEAERVTGLAGSTIYKWISGSSQPSFAGIWQLMNFYPDPYVRRALLAVATSNLNLFICEIDHDLDANRDGQVNLDDATTDAIAMVKEMGQLLEDLHAAQADGELTEKLIDEISDRTTLMVELMVRVPMIARIALQNAKPRRKAHTPQPGGLR